MLTDPGYASVRYNQAIRTEQLEKFPPVEAKETGGTKARAIVVISMIDGELQKLQAIGRKMWNKTNYTAFNRVGAKMICFEI